MPIMDGVVRQWFGQFILIVEPSPGSLRGLVKPLAIREGTPKLFARRVTARGRDVISPLLNNFCTMWQNESVFAVVDAALFCRFGC